MGNGTDSEEGCGMCMCSDINVVYVYYYSIVKIISGTNSRNPGLRLLILSSTWASLANVKIDPQGLLEMG